MASSRRFQSIVPFLAFLIVLVTTRPAFTQAADKPDAPASDGRADARVPDKPAVTAPESPDPPGGKRVFGVIPNYRTVDGSTVTSPISNSKKFYIASKDSFDYPLILFSGALAGIGQWSNQDPSFGQGTRGYAKRLGANYADQAIGNIMTEGVFPVFLHEDPRYYRRGTGNIWSRPGYAFGAIFVTHTDSSTLRFNYSEWVGNAAGTAFANVYHPDGRTVGANVGKWVEQCSLDGLAQVLKEFWPDIKQKFFERPSSSTTSSGH